MIHFRRAEQSGRFMFTSDQLPDWLCSGSNISAAEARVDVSLRLYLRSHPKLAPALQAELRDMVGD
jgi:hypothetical protein